MERTDRGMPIQGHHTTHLVYVDSDPTGQFLMGCAINYSSVSNEAKGEINSLYNCLNGVLVKNLLTKNNTHQLKNRERNLLEGWRGPLRESWKDSDNVIWKRLQQRICSHAACP